MTKSNTKSGRAAGARALPGKLAARGNIDPFIVMDVLRTANELQAQGRDVVHMEVGQPGTSAPARVIQAAHAALDQSTLGYTDALGLPELRERIAGHYAYRY